MHNEASKLWAECPNGQWILYTEDRRMITEINRRKRLLTSVRLMAEYFRTPSSARPFAWQLRLDSKVLPTVRKLAGLA